jgi:imidazolonepropionase-like amidohydrolase
MYRSIFGVEHASEPQSGSHENLAMIDRVTAITNVQVFDGESVSEAHTVVLNGAHIQALGSRALAGATIVDGAGATLMPGLIDAHVHTDMDGLRDALWFGVTTELEMNGRWSRKERKRIAERDGLADLRSPGMGITAKGGHPSQYIGTSSNLLIRLFFRYPFVSTPYEAEQFVAKQVAAGADYIKIFIEDGSCVGYPGLPVLDNETLLAAVKAAHGFDKMAIAHVTTAEEAKRAIVAGADGLAHMFFDSQPTPEFIAAIASSGAFVIPTLVTISSALGNDASVLAGDERVKSRLDKK